MPGYVTSADGTRIAYERLGNGPPLVVVGGLLNDRQSARNLAEALAPRLSVIIFDRRGRGESGDTPPYAVAREVEDLAALVDEAGGSASVYGHSSGAGLALIAVAAGVRVSGLVLHEPPYGPDDEQSKQDARDLDERIRVAVAENRRADAIGLFCTEAGMPPDMVEETSKDPALQALASTMPYDFDVMGHADQGGAIPEDLVRTVEVRTLVIAGDASPDFFRDAAARIVDLMPDATYAVLPGQDHGAPAEVVAPVVTDFLVDRAGADQP